MGIILSFFTLAIIFIILSILCSVYSTERLLCQMTAVIFSLLFIVFGIVAMCETKIGRENILTYEIDKQRYESACNNPNLTHQERNEVIQLVVKDNVYINKAKLWRGNFWLGWFQYGPVGDLPLFDITKIQYVNTKNTADYNLNIKR